MANSIVVVAMLSWTTFRALSNYKAVDQIRKPALLILILLMLQVCLGIAAFYTRVLHGREAVQPELAMVISTVSHVGLGALLLATTVILTIRLWLIGLQPGKIEMKRIPTREITEEQNDQHVTIGPAARRGACQVGLKRNRTARGSKLNPPSAQQCCAAERRRRDVGNASPSIGRIATAQTFPRHHGVDHTGQRRRIRGRTDARGRVCLAMVGRSRRNRRRSSLDHNSDGDVPAWQLVAHHREHGLPVGFWSRD